MGGAGTGPEEVERPPGQPGAAVHRHVLYRINAINDSLKKLKKDIGSKDERPPHARRKRAANQTPRHGCQLA